MAHIVDVDKEGRVSYEGLLTSSEMLPYEQMLQALKEQIPQLESELKEHYGTTVEYKYYLGRYLGSVLTKYSVSIRERRQFWDEIKYLASSETRKRNEGIKSKTRCFYEQCFVLSEIEYDTVKKLSWRQWQDILDRIDNREDERIFSWIGKLQDKIREDDWREFEKALHMFLKEKDTSVFSDEELFAVYDSILTMVVYWRTAFALFAKENSKSQKLKNKSFWSKKFYANYFEKRREEKEEIKEETLNEVFGDTLQLKT